MDARSEFGGERLIDHTVAGESALPPEGISHNIHSEMSFSARPMSGVTFMVMGFVKYLQAQGSEGFSELPRNDFLHTHQESRAKNVNGSFTDRVKRHPGADAKHVSLNLSSLRDAMNPSH